ncbi:programmed cell death protein, partial [Cladochytrium tenue]
MPIHLGFPEPFEPDDYDDDEVGEDAPTSLCCAANVFDFPHKIGGTPLWLDRTRPAPADRLTCGACGMVMPLLLQLYTPSESVPAAYFRVVYLFACKNGACHRASGQALKCLRAQLPASTPLWPSDDDYSAAASPSPPAPTCRVCGLAAPKRCARCRSAAYCCKDHQTADWTAGGHSRTCSNTTAQTNPPAADATATTAPAGRSLRAVRAATLFPELEIVTEPEPGSDDGDATEPLLERLRISRPLGDADTDAAAAAEADADLADADETVSDVDRAFLKFQKRVAREPAQVL